MHSPLLRIQQRNTVKNITFEGQQGSKVLTNASFLSSKEFAILLNKEIGHTDQSSSFGQESLKKKNKIK